MIQTENVRDQEIDKYADRCLKTKLLEILIQLAQARETASGYIKPDFMGWNIFYFYFYFSCYYYNNNYYCYNYYYYNYYCWQIYLKSFKENESQTNVSKNYILVWKNETLREILSAWLRNLLKILLCVIDTEI